METLKNAAQADSQNSDVQRLGNIADYSRCRIHFSSRINDFNLTFTNAEHTIHLTELVWEPQVFNLTFFVRQWCCAVFLYVQANAACGTIPLKGGEPTA